MEKNIILVGPMGCGKTTIGRRIARKLGMGFFDSDQQIEERTGVRIPIIFEIEGEDGFRAREECMIAELSKQDKIVLSTGGGVVMSEDNRRNLMVSGTVIYLCAPLEVLYMRTRRDRNRPLLQTQDQKQKLREIIAQRDPLYRDVADLIIETRQRSIPNVVNEIIKKLNK